MSKKNYSSGNPDSKSDFYVEFISANSGKIKISIQSKSKVLHRSKLEHTSQKAVTDLGIKHGKLSVTDNGGQYFVLQARIEAAVKKAHPKNLAESLPEFKKHARYKSKSDCLRRSRL